LHWRAVDFDLTIGTSNFDASDGTRHFFRISRDAYELR
jgi:hypothetical protein